MKNLVLVLVFGFSGWVWAESEVVYLSVGEIKTVSAPPGQVLKNSNGRVLKAIDLGSKVNLFGQKEGESHLHVGTKSYQVFVGLSNKINFIEELTEGLKLRLGLKASFADKEVIVSGQVHRFSDLLWIFELAKKHRTTFKLRASLDSDIIPEANKYIQAQLLAQSLNPVHIQWSPPLATIPENLKAQINTYEDALGPYGLSVESRSQQLNLMPSVQVEVVMAEITERLDREFGLEWSPFGEFQVLPQTSFATSLTSTLKALESRGLGKILATPRILCRSGSEAEFHSGGEFPIAITEYQSHYKSQNITWKKHGIVLKFKPQADRYGRLSIKIYAELSVLSDQQVNGTPAVLINKIESEFDLSQPRTVALSGLIRQDWHKGKNGLPWVSQIPVLSSLFSSERYLNRKSELVIFVTPKIISENSEGVKMPGGWQHDSI